MTEAIRQITLTREGVLACAALYDLGDIERELLSPEFGSTIKNGLNRGQLRRIVADWKLQAFSWTDPGKKLDSNWDETIELFTAEAFRADNPRIAAWLLCALSGVEVRSASAILTVFDPKRYTVIDVRAMSTLRILDYASLDQDRPEWLEETEFTTWLYEQYLGQCGRVARALDVPLRELDRALFYIEGKPEKYREAAA